MWGIPYLYILSNYLVFAPYFMFLDIFQCLLAYENLNRICILLVYENCINLNFVELVTVLFKPTLSFYFSVYLFY